MALLVSKKIALFSLVTATVCAVACNDDTQFTVKHAHDFSTTDALSVSVFGIYKDGAMNADAWDTLGPKLSAALHGTKCDTAYTAQRLTKDPSLAQAIDDYTRDNGITDEFLSEIAKPARGDLVLVFSVAGHPPKSSDGGAPTSFYQKSPAPRQLRGGMGGGHPTHQPTKTHHDPSAFEVSASLYSLKLGRSVALVGMRYTGPSEDEALKMFTDKLAAFMPNSSCVGFSDVPFDEKKIRDLISAGDPAAPPADPPATSAPAQ